MCDLQVLAEGLDAEQASDLGRQEGGQHLDPRQFREATQITEILADQQFFTDSPPDARTPLLTCQQGLGKRTEGQEVRQVGLTLLRDSAAGGKEPLDRIVGAEHALAPHLAE